MPHCGGAHSCNCVVTGDGVSGSGTLSDPYVITSVPEGGGAVDSVNGEVGAVVLDAADVARTVSEGGGTQILKRSLRFETIQLAG